MANDLTNVMHKILARGLMSLRETVLLTQLVNTDYSSEAAKKGDVINVPVPTSIGVIDVVPGVTDPTPVDKTPGTVAIPLDNWKQNEPFHLTDKQQAEVSKNEHFLPMYVTESLRALAGSINQTVLAQYTGVYGYVGTAGTTPFGSTVADAVQARKVLNAQLCPRRDRRMVLDHEGEANALALSAFSDFEKTGEQNAKIHGVLGTKYGFDFFADDDIPTHTVGTAFAKTVTLISNSAVGDATVTLGVDIGTATVVEGDIITIAGDLQTYVVTADATLNTSGVAVAISPTLAIAVNGSGTPVAVTLKDSHTVNLAFHRDAFALALRPLENSSVASASANIAVMSDPLTGLSLRLEVRRQHKQDAWEFDALWGTKLVRPELACRVVG